VKIIQALVVLFAVIGCLALALGGFYIYTMSQSGEDNFLTKLKNARAAETTTTATAAPTPPAPANSEYASVIQQYQPTPTPTPAGAAPVAGQPVVAAAPVATPLPQPVKTPKPDEGKIRSWATGKKWVALTYDDGPHPDWTPKMIELLKSKNVKATFFLLGGQIERFPDIAKSLADNGFEIGNHTMTHPDFNKSSMTPEKIKEELSGTNELIQQYVTRLPIRVMRPPFGNTPKKLETVCQEMGLQIIAWNIDTDDWRKEATAESMSNNIMKNLADGAIILMHDKHEKTYDATAQVIDKIRAEGYEFVTMSELLGLAPLSTGQTPVAAVPAPVAVAPIAATPAQGTLPAPAAAAQPAAANTALPVPAAAKAATPAATLDSSKITKPPPQR